MTINVILQARTGSSRLPNKILKPLHDSTVLECCINRIKKSKNINNIIIATTNLYQDSDIVNICNKNDIMYFRGDSNNVLDRFYQTALISNTSIIVRCTSDCPLIDAEELDRTIDYYLSNDYDYVRNCNNVGEWDGFDVEIFSFDILKKTWMNANTDFDKEHVTPYMKKTFKVGHYITNYNYRIDYKNLHLSLDTDEDYQYISKIFNHFNKLYFNMEDILNYISKVTITINVKSNKGQKLYKKAKEIIPGGTQLLSKRPEMFAPDTWVSYYQKTNGIEVTSLDGVKFKDFSYMSLGTCILGYNDPDVNLAVHKSVDRGNMCTLNSPNEVKLANLFLKLHPWASMVRYAKTGGESMCIAVRIARACSGKEQVAFCGYHGWHDWYLSANLNEKDALGNHLLTGLEPNGVPESLKNTAFPFKYNDYKGLKRIIKNNNIGTIVMEPLRNMEPGRFLKKVRKLCDRKNITLVFDEITSGFRVNNGGIHLKYDVNPDIAVFAKAISNGYPMGVIIGKKNVMTHAENTFISSTYWTDDVGLSATIATINKFIECDVGNYLNQLGIYYQKGLKEIANNTKINISISGIPALTSFNFDYQNSLAVRTLFTQMMMERNILAKNSLYLSYAHKEKDIDYYLENVREIFKKLKRCIDKDEVEKKLKGGVAHAGFYRLN